MDVGGIAEVFSDKIHYATISNTIGGTPVVDFNPNQYNAATSQTQWTSSTGEVWTINTGTAATGYKGQIVTKTTTQGDGIDDRLISSTINFVTPSNLFVACANLPTSPGTTAICGGNNLLYYTQDGGLRRSVKDGNVQGDATGYTARTLSLESIQISRVASSFIFSRNNLVRLTTNMGGVPLSDSSTTSLFSTFGGALHSNTIINTIMFTSTQGTSTQNTDVYNYIRSINGNAF
jgi:hypothetical protein